MRAALICLSILIAGCGTTDPTGVAVSPAHAADARVASAPRIADAPATPAAPGSSLPAFACADTGGGKTGVANVVAARVAPSLGYDRFVLQFDSLVPSYTVKRQATPIFPNGPSGQTITLSGTSGVLVHVESATGANTFTGPTDFTHAEYPVLKEARQTEDFEGHVSWGLGLGRDACMRTFTLSGPARLIVDFSTAG
ncbi:MAG: hypothetical protein M3R21_02485 [Candidatus Dormibacteraeota bacterium]|nr:hypothetical protein [Candidatus Dormibacteraeota bacterium]